jgi:VIT1/CCC1 family predicted Fe2+/Mn2+ transporter
MAHAIRQREYKHHTERHVAAGVFLRDVMLGLNDGLVASFAVTSGVAGAFTDSRVVMMAGLAEMLGGAVSMGLAAFISARSQIEFYKSEVDRERYEISRFPEQEKNEIRGIYKQKGFSGPLLDQIVAHISGDPDRWADVMMREELGFNEENFESPLKSSMVVGVSYLIGATVPVAPYLFIVPARGIVLSAIITVLVLFAVGAAKTIITSRSWWRSGIESMLTGIAAGAVTYGAGRLFGGPR